MLFLLLLINNVHNKNKLTFNLIFRKKIINFIWVFSYGLLGPSGCGKTTLLSCMVGRCQLDAGDIQVKAKTKSNIGYMPQVIFVNVYIYCYIITKYTFF